MRTIADSKFGPSLLISRGAGEPPSAAPITRSEGWVKGENDLNVLQRGDRLEIIANVDLDGLQNLKEVLTHYENILRLLSPKPPKKEENGK